MTQAAADPAAAPDGPCEHTFSVRRLGLEWPLAISSAWSSRAGCGKRGSAALSRARSAGLSGPRPWTRLACILAAQFALLAPAVPAIGAEDPKAPCVPVAFKVAIDIGHYRAASGATSATGVPEFDYNLALARAVSAALHKAGFTSVFLIGEAGTPLKLEERTRLAGAGEARLFLSMHHDSVQPRYLAEWTVNGRAERYSDRFHSYSMFISDLNPDRERSQNFAVLLGEALLGEGMTPSLHHAEPIPGEGKLLLDGRLGLYRYDNLVVLRTAPMPAVLLESAIIVNRAEEQSVQKGDHSAKVAAAIVKAVSRFCSADADVGRRPVLPSARLSPPQAPPPGRPVGPDGPATCPAGACASCGTTRSFAGAAPGPAGAPKPHCVAVEP